MIQSVILVFLQSVISAVGDLDALWTERDVNHISVPEYFIEGLRLEYCANHTHPFITVKHCHNGPDEVRNKYKFKIIGVKVCIAVNFP